MSIRDFKDTWAGRPIRPLRADALPARAEGVAWRLSFGGEEDGTFYDGPSPDTELDETEGEQLLRPLVIWDQAPQIEALVISCWGDPEEFYDTDARGAVQALVALAPRLPHVEAIFFGDIPRFMSDLAYIQSDDMGPVVRAFPKLKVFGARGGGVSFSDLRHETLEELVVESGGLGAECAADIGRGHLPNLRRLDLWLGREEYGGTITPETLQPIFSGKALPKLTRLGLMNAYNTDALAEALATAPVIEQLEELDLSMGTLTDRGLGLLLKHPALGRLRRLNLDDNFLSDAAIHLARAKLGGVEVISASHKTPYDGDWRYATHGE